MYKCLNFPLAAITKEKCFTVANKWFFGPVMRKLFGAALNHTNTKQTRGLKPLFSNMFQNVCISKQLLKLQESMNWDQ